MTESLPSGLVSLPRSCEKTLDNKYDECQTPTAKWYYNLIMIATGIYRQQTNHEVLREENSPKSGHPVCQTEESHTGKQDEC